MHKGVCAVVDGSQKFLVVVGNMFDNFQECRSTKSHPIFEWQRTICLIHLFRDLPSQDSRQSNLFSRCQLQSLRAPGEGTKVGRGVDESDQRLHSRYRCFLPREYRTLYSTPLHDDSLVVSVCFPNLPSIPKNALPYFRWQSLDKKRAHYPSLHGTFFAVSQECFGNCCQLIKVFL